jgi:cell division protein ZapA (FtsZ GTPase activity inhibitor)
MKEGKKARVEVEILNLTLTVTSDDDEQYVRNLAAYVDQRMRQIKATTKPEVPLRVAILAALNIADEYHKALKGEAEIRQEAERLASVILERIGRCEKSEKAVSSDEGPRCSFGADGHDAVPE